MNPVFPIFLPSISDIIYRTINNNYIFLFAQKINRLHLFEGKREKVKLFTLYSIIQRK